MSATSAIAGSGSTPYYFRGTSLPKTVYELIGEAVIAAADDAGLGVDDIDGMTFFASGFDVATIVEMLGMPKVTFAHCVSGYGAGMAAVLELATLAVASGKAKAVVCIGAAQQAANRYGAALGRMPATPDSIFHRIAGLNGPGQAMAMLTRRHMHEFGTRREAFGEIVIASRAAAYTRETSIRRKHLTMDEYLASPMLADPLCRLDFCLETDGALAFIVTTAERARDLKQKPVYISATAQAADRDWGRGFFWMGQTPEAFVSAGALPVADQLRKTAGYDAKDIDVACIYDHFSPMVLMQLEAYSFCKTGEGGPFVESGAIRLDGSIPVNPHGGHLSEGYVTGMTHVREAVEQLRGQAVNQIAGAKRALVTGGPAPHPLTAAILSNEP